MSKEKGETDVGCFPIKSSKQIYTATIWNFHLCSGIHYTETFRPLFPPLEVFQCVCFQKCYLLVIVRDSIADLDLKYSLVLVV